VEFRVPTLADIKKAARRFEQRPAGGGVTVCRTPMLKSAWLSERLRVETWIKLEAVQPGGSFKIRGALNALHALRDEHPEVTTVVTASAGNHGTAMAIAARQLGLSLRVHLPATAPDAKRQGLVSQGAQLIEAADYDLAEAGAREDARTSGAPYISPYNHPDVIAGAATVALEMLEDHPSLTAIVVPLGGGGLLAGAAIVVRGHTSAVRVIGAEAESSPVFTAALGAGEITPVKVHDTLADGLAGNLEPGSRTFDLVRDLVDEVALVAESSIETAMRNLACRERLIAEGAGATGVAALLQGGLTLGTGPVGVMVTGRNVDPSVLKRILQ
jgi:threonine dehydratase